MSASSTILVLEGESLHWERSNRKRPEKGTFYSYSVLFLFISVFWRQKMKKECGVRLIGSSWVKKAVEMKEKLTSTLYLGVLAVSLQFRATYIRHLFCFPALNKLVSKLDKRAVHYEEGLPKSGCLTICQPCSWKWPVEKEKELPRVETFGTRDIASTSKTRKKTTRSITADNILNDSDSEHSKWLFLQLLVNNYVLSFYCLIQILLSKNNHY